MRALGRVWLKRRGWVLDVAPTLLYLSTLFWFGLTPLKSLPGPEFELQDKVWHLMAFGGLALLIARALGYFAPQRAALRNARDGALGSVALGGLLEILQSFTSYRSTDFADFVADSLGALLAYAALRLIGSAAPRGAA